MGPEPGRGGSDDEAWPWVEGGQDRVEEADDQSKTHQDEGDKEDHQEPLGAAACPVSLLSLLQMGGEQLPGRDIPVP